MESTIMNRSMNILSAIAVVVMLVGSAQAATLQWDHDGNGTPSDGSSRWASLSYPNRWWTGSASVNWPNNTSPRDDAVFGFGGGGNKGLNLGDNSQPNPIYVANITFNNFEDRYAISKGFLNFDGVFTIDAGGGEVYIDNTAISGTGSIVLNSGILSLFANAGCTYTGTTTANGGTLWLIQKNGMSTGSDFTVNDGVTLKVNVGTGSFFNTGISGAGSLGGLLTGTTSKNKSITYNGKINLELILKESGGDFAGSIGNLAGGGSVSNLTIVSDSPSYVLTLSGAGSSYSGSTTISTGILRITNEKTLPNMTTVYIPSSVNGKINLDFTGTDYINGLVLGGVAKPKGKYDASTDPAYFTGTGSLTVGSPPGGTIIIAR